jgi:hypothetical protein
MKTISTNRSLNENFNRAQLLPVLDSETMARLRAGSWSVVKPVGTSPTVLRELEESHTLDLPLPRAAHSAIGRNFPTVLGLSMLVCLAQALAVLTGWPTNWISLAAWASRLAG